jgi:predicted DNA-binding protein (MmcQ/YjbR family)
VPWALVAVWLTKKQPWNSAIWRTSWLGVRLDVDVDWGEIDRIVREAYRLVAPKTLVARLG